MQTKIPAWAPPRRKWPKGFTAHRDGWVKSFQGKTIWVAGKTANPQDLPRLYEEKVKRMTLAIEVQGQATLPDPDGLTYADLLGAFLTYKEHEAKQNRISMRTLYNYEYELNDFGSMIGGGRRYAADIGPRDFTIVKRQLDKMSPMTVESRMARITALFKWAEAMELIEKFRPGPEWKRPRRRDIRSKRLETSKMFTPTEFAKLWRTADDRMRIWLGLGVCAAFTNTDIAHLTTDVVDLDNRRIDFARRKTGKVRRVAYIPRCVAALMRDYVRPIAVDESFEPRFFLNRDGAPLNYASNRHNTNSVTTAFNRLQIDVGVQKKGRSFTGLRTTFYNLCPPGFDEQRRIIMGRAQGTIDLDHYLEDVGTDRIIDCTRHVWNSISSELSDETRTF